MTKLIGFLLVIISLFSCEYDYNMEFDKEFTPKVVLNSLITPDSTIKVSLYWSQQPSDDTDYKIVKQFKATIYENDITIFDADCNDGKIVTGLKPKEGAQYRIEVNVPDYGVVSAKTSIPYAPQSAVTFKKPPKHNSSPYLHFNIDGIKTNSPTRSIMIRSIGVYEKDKPGSYSNNNTKFSYELYANNLFCDQFNTVIDNYDVVEKGSNTNFEYYIRIPYKNIQHSMPLAFSIRKFSTYWERIIIGTDEWGFPIYEDKEYPPTHIIETITPSDEYDKYYKSAYQQVQLNFDDMPIFNQIYPIHSNIENGLGIFAGYASAKFKLELKNDEN